MKNEAIFLSVGRADCNVLFFDQQGRQKCVVIDAGDFLEGTALKELLLKRRAEAIDWLIITHLHADHLSALDTLADFPIRRVVLPVRCPIGVDQRVLATQPGNKYLINLAMLDGFIRCCYEKKIPVEDIMTYADGGEIALGPYRLRCLYPFGDTCQPSVDHALKMCEPHLSTAECIAHETLSRRHANGDSAVWLLRKDGEDLVLFAADAPEATLWRILQKAPLHPRLVRLPHHGLPEGYFSAEVIKALAPGEAIVSTSLKMKERVWAPCHAIARECGVPIRFTFEGHLCRELP